MDGLPLVPAGTTLPPLPHLLAVSLAVVVVAAGLNRRRPAVTDRHILALIPWMALGSATHVLYIINVLPSVLAPFAGSPTIYLTVSSLAGATWLASAALRPTRVPAVLVVTGACILVPVVALALATGISPDGAFWSGVSLALTLPIAGAAWVGLTRLRPETAVTGSVGALTVFGHTLDGISTAIGTTQLGFGERTPVSRLLLELGGLPSVPILGDGGLFLLVKLAVAITITWLFAAPIRETPAEGYLLLGFAASVGIGPAAHNLLLFAVAA